MRQHTQVSPWIWHTTAKHLVSSTALVVVISDELAINNASPRKKIFSRMPFLILLTSFQSIGPPVFYGEKIIAYTIDIRFLCSFVVIGSSTYINDYAFVNQNFHWSCPGAT